jgi:hypothetical protein
VGLSATIETDSGAISKYQKIGEVIWPDSDDVLRIRTRYYLDNDARINNKKPIQVVETQIQGGAALILQAMYALLKATSPDLAGAEDVLIDEWKTEETETGNADTEKESE